MSAAGFMFHEVEGGAAPGAVQVALDRALFERATNATGWLRLHRYAPTATIGAHETLDGAVRAEYCAEHGIAVVRRPTGGGAWYHDPDQLACTLAFPLDDGARALTLAAWMQRLADAVVAALAAVGVTAGYRAPDEIEVAGRRLGSLFIARDEHAILFQAVLLLDLDVETMLKVLRAPTEKLTAEGAQNARERLVTLRQCARGIAAAQLNGALRRAFADSFGARIDATPAAWSPPDPTMPVRDNADPPLSHTAFLKTEGGLLRIALTLDATDTVVAARLTGGVHLAPPTLLDALSRALIGCPAAEAVEALAARYRDSHGDIVGADVEDLRYLLALALARPTLQATFALDGKEANSVMLHSPSRTDTVDAILQRATVMLLPYCAKPTWCKWRHRDGCVECGECEVGDAYRLARERGLRAITVMNYEHLCETLAQMRADGVDAYVGACCADFFQKREYAFRAAAIPGVLLDISGANCYVLRQQDLAYQGRFEAQSRLNVSVLERLIANVRLQDRPESRGTD